MAQNTKFTKQENPTEPEWRPRASSKIFVIAIGTSTKEELKRRLETDVAREIGGCLIADMDAKEVDNCFEFVKKYLPEQSIVAVPLTPEGEIIGGSKNMIKVLAHRHLYSDVLNSAIKKAKRIILRLGITVIEIWCSTGGHSIITVEALLKLQDICRYRKVILIQATESLARRNEPELLTFFKKWAGETILNVERLEENQFFHAINPDGDQNVDCAIAIAISSTYGLPNSDGTDFVAKLCDVQEGCITKPQAFELKSVAGSYPLYSYMMFWSRQNVHRTERAVAKAFDDIQLSDASLAVISGNIVSNFIERQRKRLYDKFGVRPDIRQFNQIKIESLSIDGFNFCISKIELLNGVISDTPTIDLLFKKMKDMP